MNSKPRGFDTPNLYREDTIARIRRMEAEIDGIARKINRLIEKEKLPVERMPYLNEPDEEDDKPE